MRKLCLIIVTTFLLFAFTACQEKDAALNPILEQPTARMETVTETQIVDNSLIGQWIMTGVIYEGNVVFLKDNPELNELYKYHWMIIEENGTYLRQEKALTNKGTWMNAGIQDDKNLYLVQQESYIRYDMENGAVKEIVQPCDTLYFLYHMEEDDTFLIYEADDLEFPYIFQKSDNLEGDSYMPADEHSTRESTPSRDSGSTPTVGEKNALKRAKAYLDYSAFSYTGLIEQLEYEDFTHSEAKYGADHCGADWNEQALKRARAYLDYSAFSYQGLIEQLEYEGFTHSQAVYAVEIAYKE